MALSSVREGKSVLFTHAVGLGVCQTQRKIKCKEKCKMRGKGYQLLLFLEYSKNFIANEFTIDFFYDIMIIGIKWILYQTKRKKMFHKGDKL